MLDKANINEKSGKHQHFILNSVQDLPIAEGSSIKVKINNDEWYRGRYQVDTTKGTPEALLFAGDKTFVIPTGSEIELINGPQ